VPRQRQVELNEATSNAIKATARRLMAEKGTAGLSLRAIARELDLTAPALYHYFGSLDDLITALIVDGFTSHAAYVRQASIRAATAGASPAQQLLAAVLAYRAWALEQPIDFQLIYGNPIPGYAAPPAVTVPAASLLGQLFMELLMAAAAAGALALTEAQQQVPPLVLAHYQARFGIDVLAAPLFHLMNQVWSLLHGMVALEIYHHLGPVVGDTNSFYEQSIRHQLQTIGLSIM
jgi:AcrR family transcriptional regulator